MWFGLVVFHVISTLVGDLMPNPVYANTYYFLNEMPSHWEELEKILNIKCFYIAFEYIVFYLLPEDNLKCQKCVEEK